MVEKKIHGVYNTVLALPPPPSPSVHHPAVESTRLASSVNSGGTHDGTTRGQLCRSARAPTSTPALNNAGRSTEVHELRAFAPCSVRSSGRSSLA